MPASDFRSDTVTKPTPAMREAMAQAEVGDDVFGDDPTVRRLEELAADTFGKEAGLFVPSGTMANQIAIRTHTRPGDEVILDRHAHVLQYEVGGIAVHSGVQVHPLDGPRGVLEVEAVAAAVRPDNLHCPRTRLIAVENTHNMWSGAVQPWAALVALSAFARDRGLALHLDGARIFNASVASGIGVRDYAALFDTVSCCLSKGLGAPIGSVLVGPRAFIDEARRTRKLMGGGMRQAGVIAAPAILALTEGPKHLAADHARARRLAEHFAALPGLRLVAPPIETNIVIFRHQGGAAAHQRIQDALAADGVLCSNIWGRALRFVTHRDVGDDDVARACRALTRAVETPAG